MEDSRSGWRAYPRSLHPERCDPYTFDVGHYEQLLQENSDRLFVANADIRIKVIEEGGKGVP